MKKLLIALVAIGVIGGVVAYQIYNKPHRDIDAEKPVASVSADDLFSAFDADEAAANTSYLDQVIEVSGTVDEITEDADGNTVVILMAETAIMGGVSATIDPSITEFSASPGDALKIKGRCTGMLMDVVLTNCFLVK
jgi:hypothetical protein